MHKIGFIYILSNPAFDNLLKVGKTQSHPIKRAQELSSSTGIPEPFVVEWFQLVSRATEAEKDAHAALQTFRHNKNREFFCIATTECIRITSEATNRYKISTYKNPQIINNNVTLQEHTIKLDSTPPLSPIEKNRKDRDELLLKINKIRKQLFEYEQRIHDVAHSKDYAHNRSTQLKELKNQKRICIHKIAKFEQKIIKLNKEHNILLLRKDILET